MSAINQNAPRMRRHKRRILDDGSELAHAVRAFVDDQIDDNALFARQADGANGIGPGRGSDAPPMGIGGLGEDGTSSTDSSNATPTTTRGSNGNGNGNGNNRPTPTATSTSLSRNLFPTTTSTSSSSNFLGGILGGLRDSSSSTSFTTSSSSTSTSSSTRSTSTSSSTRSTSSSSSTSSVSVHSDSETATQQQQQQQQPQTTSERNDDDTTSTRNDSSSSSTSLVPITATAVVTSTPTASIASATASASPKSSSSSAGPIIGIVAGALVGVVVLSGLVGFLFKKYKSKEDPYEANPFDRDAFQRHSAMIPDHFDSDDGHAGAGGMSPEMSEHYQYNNYAPQYESGISAGAAGAMGAMAAHNEGGPRPPTMFAKHAAGVQQNAPQVGGYYKDGDYANQMPAMPPHSDYHAPPTAAFANHHAAEHYLEEPGFGQQRSVSPAPQLPPLAAFGGDPYSIAGVGRGQQQNVANPYAHLDRSHAGMGGFVPGAVVPGHAGSASVSSGGDSADRHASISAAEALAAGLAHQSSLNRAASPHHAATHDTAGRPSTSEGRSGTPDIPNVQQTYALPGDVAGAAGSHRISAGSQDMLSNAATSPVGAMRNPFDNPAPHHAPQHHYADASQQLQVRNLVPANAGLSAGQRPVSTASSFADPEDAYGGVY